MLVALSSNLYSARKVNSLVLLSNSIFFRTLTLDTVAEGLALSQNIYCCSEFDPLIYYATLDSILYQEIYLKNRAYSSMPELEYTFFIA